MEEPLAAALGAGVDITQPEGHMVVDIGGGDHRRGGHRPGGVVASACLSTAGDQFDEALMQYIRQKHSLLIGARTAEEVKEAIGRVDGPGEETLAVKGRCLNTGLPREILLSGEETAEALTPVAENIISAVQAGPGAHAAGTGRRCGGQRHPPHRGRQPAPGHGHPAGCPDRDGDPPGRGPHPRRGPGGWSRPCPTWPNGRKGS